MRLSIAAIGRLRPAEPEGALVADWLGRAEATGRRLGLGPITVSEVDERKFTNREAQGERLQALIPQAACSIALDERGKVMSSTALAELISRERDQGCPEMVFLIGGADGLSPQLRDSADHLLSFGPMVWPHRLARAMLAEQIYRAASILAGLPYHRE